METKIDRQERDRTFIGRRRRLIGLWRRVGPVLLLAIAGLLVYLHVRTPLLVSPVEVARRLEEGSLDQATLSMMAVMLPLMSLAIFGLSFLITVFVYAMVSNEKRYLAIIERAER